MKSEGVGRLPGEIFPELVPAGVDGTSSEIVPCNPPDHDLAMTGRREVKVGSDISLAPRGHQHDRDALVVDELRVALERLDPQDGLIIGCPLFPTLAESERRLPFCFHVDDCLVITDPSVEMWPLTTIGRIGMPHP